MTPVEEDLLRYQCKLLGLEKTIHNSFWDYHKAITEEIMKLKGIEGF